MNGRRLVGSVVVLITGLVGGLVSAGSGPALGAALACRNTAIPLGVEEARITGTVGSNPDPVSRRIIAAGGMDALVSSFEQDLCGITAQPAALTFARQRGQALWDAAVARAKAAPVPGQLPPSDDRPLYWARLSMAAALKQWTPAFTPNLGALRKEFEYASRGVFSSDFPSAAKTYKVFISGFDPFALGPPFIGADLRKGNVSGASVLALDGAQWTVGGHTVHLQAVILPVRYVTFENRIVEDAFDPHLMPGVQQADLITTVSETPGSTFDLEMFNGRRHSAENVPDNDGVTRGSATAPTVIPNVGAGPEFTGSTLPLTAMVAALPAGVANPNPVVYEIPFGKTAVMRSPTGPTKRSTAVSGGGGGYLSNEVAYRVTLRRDILKVPVRAGHVHAPALGVPAHATDVTTSAFETRRELLVSQYRDLLRGGIAALPPPVRVALNINGGTRSVQIVEPGQEGLFDFTGTAGAAVRIRFPLNCGTCGATGFNPTGSVTLRGPDGGVVLSDPNISTYPFPFDTPVTLPATGGYTVQFEPLESQLGFFGVLLGDVPDSSGRVEIDGDVGWTRAGTPLTLPAPSGAKFDIIYQGTDFTAYLRIIHPNPPPNCPQVLYENRIDAPGYSHITVPANCGTDYRVEVAPLNTQTGVLYLRLFTPPSRVQGSPGVIATVDNGGADGVAVGRLPGQGHEVSFTATAGQRISATFLGTQGAPNTILSGPGIAPISLGRTYPNAFIEPMVLAGGTYTFTTTAYEYYTGVFRVQLYEVPPDPVVVALVNGPAVSAATAVPGQNVALRFDGVSGQVSTVALTVPALTEVTLYRPDGTVQAVTSSGIGTSAKFTAVSLPQTGTYELRANLYRDVTGTATALVTTTAG